jgi:tRNA nucleotidyltransferase (CCA-adding enzyme)
MSERYLTEENISSFPLFRLRAAERLGNGRKNEAVTGRQRDFERRLIEVYKKGKSLEIKDLAVDGNVIMDTFKLKPGIKVGAVLKFLLDKVLEDPNVNTEIELLKLATEYLHKRKIEGV